MSDYNDLYELMVEERSRAEKAEADKHDAQSQLASATDLANSWARESHVREARDESDLRGVIDRLWSRMSVELSKGREAVAMIAQVHRYAIELFAVLAPQCKPLDDALGVMTQIDNALCGITKRYCKEDETPQQRVERYHEETLTLMQMLADEKGKTETAHATLAASEQKCAELAAALDSAITELQSSEDASAREWGESPRNVTERFVDTSAILLAYRAQVERELRRTLWLNHGCVALYGDDGEMQCGDCLTDFKREALSELFVKVLYHAEKVVERETRQRIEAVLQSEGWWHVAWEYIEREFAPKDAPKGKADERPA